MPESKTCPTCGLEMTFAGENDFRTGGMGGGWKLLFGELAEATEDIIPLVVYISRSVEGRVLCK